MTKAHRSAFLAVTLTTLALSGLACSAQSAVDEGFERNRLAAVFIRIQVGEDGPSGLGTGVLIGRDGLVLTNRHVIFAGQEMSTPDVQLEVCPYSGGFTKDCRPGKIFAVSSTDDLALIKTDLPSGGALAIRPDGEPMVEVELVYARQGFAGFLPPTLVLGRFMGNTVSDGGMALEVFDLPTTVGSSGGPIFDRQNRLVGLTSMVTGFRGTPLNLAMPFTSIRRFLAENQLYF